MAKTSAGMLMVGKKDFSLSEFTKNYSHFAMEDITGDLVVDGLKFYMGLRKDLGKETHKILLTNHRRKIGVRVPSENMQMVNANPNNVYSTAQR